MKTKMFKWKKKFLWKKTLDLDYFQNKFTANQVQNRKIQDKGGNENVFCFPQNNPT